MSNYSALLTGLRSGKSLHRQPDFVKIKLFFNAKKAKRAKNAKRVQGVNHNLLLKTG